MIGIVDSGVGGLSVFLPLRAALPNTDITYLADAEFAPYGEKSQAELIDRLRSITQWLAHRGAMILVLACNTATVNTIDDLRSEFPDLEFVGMEPAVKLAAQQTDRIIVLGTESTVNNQRYHELVEQWAGGKKLWQIGANQLVRQVETGKLQDDMELERLLSLPSREAQSVVIGCSHFSFLKPTIQQRWPFLRIFDGADGVVERARTKAIQHQADHGMGMSQFFTTGQVRLVRFVHPPIHFEHTDLSC